LAFGEEEALGPSEILLAPCPALGAAFYAWHGFAPLVFGKQDGCGQTQKRRSQRVCFRGWPPRGGLGSLAGAKRPAGTRVALPGALFAKSEFRKVLHGRRKAAPTRSVRNPEREIRRLRCRMAASARSWPCRRG